jgi:hypothetical protein
MRSLRIAVFLILLTLVRTDATAGPLLTFDWYTSNIHFGLDRSFQHAWDLRVGLPNFPPPDLGYSLFSDVFTETGPLAQLILQRDAHGAVVQTDYFYTGGTLTALIDLELWDLDIVDGSFERVTGVFTAPILSTHIRVRELDEVIETYYRIGGGVFDPALARALGIGRRTKPGEMAAVDSYTHVFYDPPGDYTSLYRRGDDGGLILTAQAPEPTVACLTLIAFGIARLRRRR